MFFPVITTLRKFLIRKLAGKMGVCLNCTLLVDEKGAPGIAYTTDTGGVCENLTFGAGM